MYSVVLLMAMSTSADLPVCHRRGGRGCGCYGGGGYAGCYGGGCYGGCYGGCFGGGCYGGCAGVMNGCCGAAQPEPEPEPQPDNNNNGGNNNGNDNARRYFRAPATLIVKVPANARLTIDGRVTRSNSKVRVFASPALPQGKAFYYTLKARVERDGKTIVTTKRVRVRAGRLTRVSLKPSQGVVLNK
jgi:uncharacterized protein (TIGR03000 family)